MLDCRLGVKVHLGFYAIDNNPYVVDGKTINIFEDIKKSIQVRERLLKASRAKDGQDE